MVKPICKDTTSELIVNVVGLKQQLDHTQKQLVTKCNQLEIAVDALKLLNSEGKRTMILGLISITDTALDKITALEQKDK